MESSRQPSCLFLLFILYAKFSKIILTFGLCFQALQDKSSEFSQETTRLNEEKVGGLY